MDLPIKGLDNSSHQCEFVDIRLFLNITCNVAMPIVRGDKTGRPRPVEVEGDSEEGRDILMLDCTPNT
jgi:hypothetical protein